MLWSVNTIRLDRSGESKHRPPGAESGHIDDGAEE